MVAWVVTGRRVLSQREDLSFRYGWMPVVSPEQGRETVGLHLNLRRRDCEQNKAGVQRGVYGYPGSRGAQ